MRVRYFLPINPLRSLKHTSDQYKGYQKRQVEPFSILNPDRHPVTLIYTLNEHFIIWC